VKATIGIDIEAPARVVFDLAREVERWPDLLPHYLRVRVRTRNPDGSQVAEMVAVRRLPGPLGLGIPVAWRARTWAEADSLRLRFRHIGGATGGMDVTWRIESTETGCRVTIEHDFRPKLAVWAAIVDRLFVRPIAGRTLATFKSIAEAVTARDPADRSEAASTPKTST
jgi:ribosome-associated toxin RatA of RatAB toxin-antitoxin module